MVRLATWRKESGTRIGGTRDLDRGKVQAPCIVRAPGGGFRLFYTAVGPARPFVHCQGYILSAMSMDGLYFKPEDGVRVAPDPKAAERSLRVLAPSIVRAGRGWRMYFEARGPADMPSVICSAVSIDQVSWDLEAGMRLGGGLSVGAPRACLLPGGGVRLLAFRKEPNGTAVISAVSNDGLAFASAPEVLLRDRSDALDGMGITAAELVPPEQPGEPWALLYSAWQDRPPDSPPPPLHPSLDPNAVATGASADFAAASIAADMSGYRSRILLANSADGSSWSRGRVVIAGDGYGGIEPDAVHAEDMSVIALPDGRHRMYYAACDAAGTWRILSAISA